MTPTEQLLEQTTAFCEAFRTFLQRQTPALDDLCKRLTQIVQQLRKNIEVRDTTFSADFNTYVQELRSALDAHLAAWAQLRTEIRQVPDKSWAADLALGAKGFNSRAKALSASCDEFTTAYDAFCKQYKNFTAAKLHVFLLTACQGDSVNITGQVLFLARELARKTEQNRGY